MSKVRTAKKPAEEKRPTYQDALDESLQETFPASDPISPSVGNTGRRISTEKNPTDWQLQPDSTAKNEGSATSAGDASSAARSSDVMPTTSVPSDAGLDDIYQELKRGVGRELVTDANVDALIQLAVERRDEQLEYLLREWRSECGEEADQHKR
jgi:hypothetical protein